MPNNVSTSGRSQDLLCSTTPLLLTNKETNLHEIISK